MKHENSSYEPIFVSYDDENIDHVLNGPDYGQPPTSSKKTVWSELDSDEYPEYVEEICKKILKSLPLKIA